jgi:hypothetical protein
MLAKLGKFIDLRLACTISVGILGALTTYELLAAVLHWWASGWTDLTYQQQAGLDIAFTATMLGASFYILFRLVRRIRNVRRLRAAGLRVPVWPAPRP